MITANEVLMGRDQKWPLSPELKNNLDTLLIALNMFRGYYNKPMNVSSGYRPAAINVLIKNAASHSAHSECLACDFHDLNGELDKFCMANLDILEHCGLYLEHPDNTPNWCHLTVRPPKSGKRVFYA